MTLASPRLTAALILSVACTIAMASHCLAAEPLSVDPLNEPEATAAEPQIPEVAAAIEALRQSKYDDAVTKLQEAFKKHPELSPPHVMLARFFSQVQGGGQSMRTSLEKAIIDLPNDPEAYVFLGNVCVREGRVTEADLLFTKANQLMAGFEGHADRKKAMQPQIVFGLASVALARQDWAGAEKRLLELLQLDPENMSAMTRLPLALFKQATPEKTKAANDWTKRAYEADTNDPKKVFPPPTQMARLYAQADDGTSKRNFDAAKQWMDFAYSQHDDHLETVLEVAQWYWRTCQRELKTNQAHLDAAERYAAKARQIDPESARAMIFSGIVALFKRDFSSAERFFDDAGEKSYSSFAAKNNLALALCEQAVPKKKQRALALAAETATLHGKSRNAPEAFSTLGWVLFQNNQLAKADEALRRAVAAGARSADTAYYMAAVLAESNTEKAKTRAIQLLTSAVQTKLPFSKREEAEALLAELKQP